MQSLRMFPMDLYSTDLYLYFFFNDAATTEIYTLSLHDALPISPRRNSRCRRCSTVPGLPSSAGVLEQWKDRKSTRLNSSHANISYAVFCLKKKKCLMSGHIPTI